jgi:CelD/BcsL family acetyltransferase involved in cellulose biosynthesis
VTDPGERSGRETAPVRLVRIPLDDPAWSRVVETDPNALPFHHPDWAQMLADCYGFSGFGLALRDGGGTVVAGVPIVETRGVLGRRRWISLPFTDFCPPLLAENSVISMSLEAEIDRARQDAGVGSVELRARFPSGRSPIRPGGFRHTLRLEPDPEMTFSRLKPSVRNKIRSASKGKLTVARAEHEADLTRTFYGLHTATRRRLGVPVQPRRYFSLLWRRFLEPGLGFVLIARTGTKPVGAAVFLAWNGTAIYKYGASDAAYWNLRPNNAVLWHAIKWACENGYSIFDFGRTELANEGLREFKRGWGTEETSLTYSVVGPTRVSASKAERAAQLTRPVIRHAPPFVCRALGRALYRYAA